jgi:hypothetical protein
MRFMLTISANQQSEAGMPPSSELMTAVGRLTEEMTSKGILVETGGLMPSSTGARLRLSGGKVTVTDGPFAEAKELIGGYAIVQVNSREEAIQLGKRFLQIHADTLGPSYEAVSDIRQMFEAPQAACGNRS